MIKKVVPFLILCFSLLLISATSTKKEIGKMKIVQAKIIVEDSSPQLNLKLNEWLIQQRIKRENIVSTDFDCCGGGKRVLVFYEVEYVEEKEAE